MKCCKDSFKTKPQLEPESSQEDKENNQNIHNTTSEATPMKRPKRLIDPVVELKDNTWLIRDQVKQKIEQRDVRVTDHIDIIGCEKSNIGIEGRCKSLLIENCRKVTIIV